MKQAAQRFQPFQSTPFSSALFQFEKFLRLRPALCHYPQDSTSARICSATSFTGISGIWLLQNTSCRRWKTGILNDFQLWPCRLPNPWRLYYLDWNCVKMCWILVTTVQHEQEIEMPTIEWTNKLADSLVFIKDSRSAPRTFRHSERSWRFPLASMATLIGASPADGHSDRTTVTFTWKHWPASNANGQWAHSTTIVTLRHLKQVENLLGTQRMTNFFCTTVRDANAAKHTKSSWAHAADQQCFQQWWCEFAGLRSAAVLWNHLLDPQQEKDWKGTVFRR